MRGHIPEETSFQIPYQNWNRPHLERRASDPHKSNTSVHGHGYCRSQYKAMEVLKAFVAESESVSGWRPSLHFQLTSSHSAPDDMAESSGLSMEVRISDESGLVGASGSLEAALEALEMAEELSECQRCPLALPRLPQYWGTIQTGEDG
jgi:hypothetical protein